MTPPACAALGTILGAFLTLSATPPASAECVGRNLFSDKSSAPVAEELERKASTMPFREGRFWKISRDGMTPSYLYGTLHVSDPRLATLPPVVAGRVAQAAIVAVETTDVSSLGVGRLDAKSRGDLQESIRAAPERRAEKLLDPQDYAALKRLAKERGVPNSGARTWKAATLAVMLDSPACAKEASFNQAYLDAQVARLARDRGIELIGLETLIEQFSALDGLSPEIERALLLSVLRQSPYAKDAVETQIARYLERDAAGVVALMRLGPVPGDLEARTPPEFLDRLLDARTKRMAERLLPLLVRGNAVVAVGIAHLPGRNGLLAALERSGYTAVPVD